MVMGKDDPRGPVFQCEPQQLFDIHRGEVIATFTDQLLRDEPAPPSKIKHPEFFVRQIAIYMLQVVINTPAAVEHRALSCLLFFAPPTEFQRCYDTDCLFLAYAFIAAPSGPRQPRKLVQVVPPTRPAAP